jgi:hypothetical protein
LDRRCAPAIHVARNPESRRARGNRDGYFSGAKPGCKTKATEHDQAPARPSLGSSRFFGLNSIPALRETNPRALVFKSDNLVGQPA